MSGWDGRDRTKWQRSLADGKRSSGGSCANHEPHELRWNVPFLPSLPRYSLFWHRDSRAIHNNIAPSRLHALHTFSFGLAGLLTTLRSSQLRPQIEWTAVGEWDWLKRSGRRTMTARQSRDHPSSSSCPSHLDTFPLYHRHTTTSHHFHLCLLTSPHNHHLQAPAVTMSPASPPSRDQGAETAPPPVPASRASATTTSPRQPLGARVDTVNGRAIVVPSPALLPTNRQPSTAAGNASPAARPDRDRLSATQGPPPQSSHHNQANLPQDNGTASGGTADQTASDANANSSSAAPRPQVPNAWIRDDDLLLTRLVTRFGKKWSKVGRRHMTFRG